MVPVDFSEFGAHALRYGCEMAIRFQAQLHLVHVVETYSPMIPGEGMLLVDRSEYVRELTAAAEKQLSKIPEAGWLDESRIVRSVRSGTPFVEIIRYAKEYAIELIVIGTHGRSGLAHVLMGSVAERVVRKAPCPVLTVRPGQHEFVMP